LGAISAGALAARRIIAYDSAPEARRKIKRIKARLAGDVGEVVKAADYIFICVKPQKIEEVLAEIRAASADVASEKKCFVSIAAGITLERLAESLGRKIPLIRVMPNTPALLGKGMSVLSAGSNATNKDVERVRRILQSVGEVAIMPENFMDAVTAVSGSGPAYAFYLAESMIEAAEELGLPAAIAERLVRQTISGAGEMLGAMKEGPRNLREQVTSPGGTTAAAIGEFENQGFKEIVKSAIKKAAERSREIGAGS